MSRPKLNTFDVIIENIPPQVDRSEIEYLFKSCGEICNVFLRQSKYNKNKLAYVKYYCEPDAIKAVKKYEHLSLHGYALNVKLLPPKIENQGSYRQASIPKSPYGVPSGNNVYNFSAASNEANKVFNQKSGEIIVLVCHIENPVTFYGQSVTNLVELATISSRLQEFCTVSPPLVGAPHVNQIYGARFSQDQVWYRCRIIQHAERNRSFVSYIDYGNQEEVNNNGIVMLPDDLVKIPPQSSMFILKDLKVIVAEDNVDVYTKAVEYMKELINQRVQVHVSFSTDGFYCVDKFTFQGVDVYNELQKKGFAKKQLSPDLSQKDMKISGVNEKICDHSPNSKGTQKSPNGRGNSRNANSFVDNAPKAATNFKSPQSHSVVPGKEHYEELEKLRNQNKKLNQELTLEKKKSQILKQELAVLKAKPQPPDILSKIDSVLQKTQRLFVMRSQHSPKDNNLEEVYDVVKAKFSSAAVASDLHAEVEEAVSKYHSCVEKVGECEESDLIQDHIKERDEACRTACDIMKKFLDSWNGDHLTERVVFLQNLHSEMEVNYEMYLKADVDCPDKSLPELIDEYRENKVESKTSSETLVKNTDNALNQFSSLIGDLQKDIAVPPSDKPTNVDICVRFSTGKFLECLKEVEETIDTEIIAKSREPKCQPNEALMTSLIKVLLKEIKAPLDAAVHEIKDCNKYNLLYPELSNNLKISPDTSKIYEIRKAIKALKSKLRHKLADKKDLEESDELNTTELAEINSSLDLLLRDLHLRFKEEHDEMMTLVQLYKTHFRELSINNPDLNLISYSKYDGLLRENWEMEHFHVCCIIKRPGICYSAKFCDESVVIKEYHLNNDEREEFFAKIQPWHSIEQDNVIPVNAVFKSKTGFQIYAVFPFFTTLEEQLKKEIPFIHSNAGLVLHGVLKGLECIHSRSLAHSLLNPSTVLITSCTSILDFSFGVNHTSAPWESKGIIFSPPEKELSQNSDMYNFGCLILWMLFPNLQFSSTSDGVVDVAAYKSIVQDLLSPSGYEILEALLSIDPSKRPSSKSLLEKDFFVELTRRNSVDELSNASTPVSQASENSVVMLSESPEEVTDTSSVHTVSD